MQTRMITILCLDSVKRMCTQPLRKIKQNYRQVSLMCHPDKNPDKPRDEVEERYKAIQSAFTTLTDNFKRRHYDSQMDFDDSVPDKDEKGDFYRI
eukprot:TRINITY_DN605_c0_g1_i1.p1 TRINITY_DN605_c0_g1~~TRINITY_DN605_c0_g1_i1.p1  ORF type:complete len:95 (-),score=13.16 TRINITY_DN605_c0_g1_i1:10-294(-)